MTDGTICNAIGSISVSGSADAWWQAKGADVITNGNISSDIPVTCIAPSCDPLLISGDPAVPMTSVSGNVSWTFNFRLGGGRFDWLGLCWRSV